MLFASLAISKLSRLTRILALAAVNIINFFTSQIINLKNQLNNIEMTFTNTPIIFLFLLFSFLLCLFEKTLFKYAYVWKRGAVESVCTLHTRLHVINEVYANFIPTYS